MLVEGGQGYTCGDVVISRDAECVCGNKTIRYEDDKGCCGHIHCTIVNGTGICIGGEVCTAGAWGWKTIPCGALVVSELKQCQCGDSTIDIDDYSADQTWCCLGLSSCEYNEGRGYCANGT